MDVTVHYIKRGAKEVDNACGYPVISATGINVRRLGKPGATPKAVSRSDAKK